MHHSGRASNSTGEPCEARCGAGAGRTSSPLCPITGVPPHPKAHHARANSHTRADTHRQYQPRSSRFHKPASTPNARDQYHTLTRRVDWPQQSEVHLASSAADRRDTHRTPRRSLPQRARCRADEFVLSLPRDTKSRNQPPLHPHSSESGYRGWTTLSATPVPLPAGAECDNGPGSGTWLSIHWPAKSGLLAFPWVDPIKRDAALKISLARRSSRFSRSSSRIHSRSKVVTPPNRRPPSTCARRSVSLVIPTLPEIDPIAAHSEGYSPPCSSTSLTARSRSSCGYLVVLVISPSSQRMESPTLPGRFNDQQ